MSTVSRQKKGECWTTGGEGVASKRKGGEGVKTASRGNKIKPSHVQEKQGGRGAKMPTDENCSGVMETEGGSTGYTKGN